jgi:AcrR family transcriptional regulator
MTARARKAAPVDRADVAERIEQAARRRFILHGYNGVSYLDIGADLGITHSSIHYYYRTKAQLAEAVLRRVADATVESMRSIWVDPATTLADKFVATRDWIHTQYLEFNPDGKGGRPWGLLARFSLDADDLSPGMKRVIRGSLDKLEQHIATGVALAVRSGELIADAPQAGITLQITSLMSITGQITRGASGFERLDDLFRWTYLALARAYGAPRRSIPAWPPVPRITGAAKTVRAADAAAATAT